MLSAQSLSRTLTGAILMVLVASVGIAAAQTSGTMTAPPPQAVQQPAPQAPQQGAPAAAVAGQAASVCANQPYCYEAQDFVAVVTDFRTSVAGYSKAIDVTMRFLNKTPNVLVLGYTNGSGIALDDRGIRYGVGGPNAIRGMGLVNGGSFDPKFSIRPGGFADSRFELLTPNSSQTIYGFTFELDMSVNEISTLEGNQHSLGSEFPLQFQGLTNGAKGNVPGIPAGGSGFFGGGANPMMTASAAPACGPAGTLNSMAGATNSAAAQNAANTATTTASNATNALSNLKSLFGKKNAAAQPAPAATAAPCPPAAANPAAVNPVGVNPAVASPAAGASPAVAANPVNGAATQAPAANAPATGVATAAGVKAPVASAAPTAKPAAAQPAKPAAKKPATPAATTQQKPQQP